MFFFCPQVSETLKCQTIGNGGNRKFRKPFLLFSYHWICFPGPVEVVWYERLEAIAIAISYVKCGVCVPGFRDLSFPPLSGGDLMIAASARFFWHKLIRVPPPLIFHPLYALNHSSRKNKNKISYAYKYLKQQLKKSQWPQSASKL